MSDDELADFLGIKNEPNKDKFIAALPADQRATFEHMKKVCDDIRLWEAGVGPKPTGVILCHDHAPKKRKARPT